VLVCTVSHSQLEESPTEKAYDDKQPAYDSERYRVRRSQRLCITLENLLKAGRVKFQSLQGRNKVIEEGVSRMDIPTFALSASYTSIKSGNSSLKYLNYNET
jgi:hypothetical protein